MTTHEIDSWLWDESQQAAVNWFRAQCENPTVPFQLFFKPYAARIVAAREKPPGFELAAGEIFQSRWTLEYATRWIHDIGRFLPVLTPAMVA
jgi:hypothetical protein